MSELAVVGQTSPRSTTPAWAPIRIMLLDQQRLFHACVEALIRTERDLEYIQGFSSLNDFMGSMDRLQPDVILVDFDLVESGVMEFVSRIELAAPRCRVIVLTEAADLSLIRSVMSAGADGCVVKTASSGELMFAVRAVSGGQRFLCSSAARAGLTARTRRDEVTTGCSPVITARERELLSCVLAGNSNKLTARQLGLSPKTVSKHRANLMRKLKLSNVSALARFAYRTGLAG